MLQSEILDAGTLCVASDGGWNLGKGQKVRGAAVVVVSSTGNSRGSTGARRRPRRRSGPSRPRPRSPPKLVSRCRPRGGWGSASARRPPRGAARARSAAHRLRSRPGGRADRERRAPPEDAACQCSRSAKGVKGPARQNHGSLEPLRDSSCGAFNARGPNPARGVDGARRRTSRIETEIEVKQKPSSSEEE